MPGPYAHITLLHELMRPARLESIFAPSTGCHSALQAYFPYCTLGAISPDYPNLVQGDAQWADGMHNTRACEMVSNGIRRARASIGATRDKQLSWLLGYCAHVATDVTIHPVVQARVGLYAENQRQHRVCEMNQDSYIYRRMNLGEIGESDNFALTVTLCSNPDDVTQLDRDISMLWEGMLADVYPELFFEKLPESTSWHQQFVTRIDKCGAGTPKLFPLADLIAEKMKLAYPLYDMVDKQFIENQLVPAEKPHHLHYDDIFDRAVGNVAVVWKLVELALDDDDPAYQPSFGDWNLDNGCDEHGRLVFW